MNPSPVPDPWLSRFREQVTAGIAGVMVAALLVLLGLALLNADSADGFARVKDLLLFVNPLVGYVIGYYFSKASTEARAESAEASVATTAAVAHQATQQREEAQAEAVQAKDEARQVASTLSELEQAAEVYLAQSAARRPGVLDGNGEELARGSDTQLQVALERAKQMLQRIS